MPLGSPKHDPISDQKMSFFITDSMQNKVGKVCPLFRPKRLRTHYLRGGTYLYIYIRTYMFMFFIYTMNSTSAIFK